MAKKNSLEQGVHFTVPSVRELEGKIISISDYGVQFRYRKPGGSTLITEMFPFNDSLYAVIGKEGAENSRILLKGTKEIFGNKKRNTCIATSVSGHIPGFIKGDGGKEIGTFIINANFSEFRAEEAGEGGRGRKKATEEKPSKKSDKVEAKAKKKKTTKKSEDDDWDDE